MHWTRKNVSQWLNWAAQEFQMNQVDPNNFPFSGPQLCSLSKEEFLNRAPPYTGDILYSHLNLLKAKGSFLALFPCIFATLVLFFLFDKEEVA